MTTNGKISSAILADKEFREEILKKYKEGIIKKPFLYRFSDQDFFFFLGEDNYIMYNFFPEIQGSGKLIGLSFFISKEKHRDIQKEIGLKQKKEEKQKEGFEIIIDLEEGGENE